MTPAPDVSIGSLPLVWPVASHLGFLETARWLNDATGAIVLSGWCLPAARSSTPWTRFVARVNEREIASCAPFARPDVAAAYPDHVSAESAGFDLRLPILPPEATIVLVVESSAADRRELVRFGTWQLAGRTPSPIDYGYWSAANRSSRTTSTSSPTAGPTFSIVVPVYDPPLEALVNCVASLGTQSYERWEAILVDDGAPNPAIRQQLAALVQRDPRIRLITSPRNLGIAGASNLGISHARHDWIAFLDHDDRLIPTALAVLAADIVQCPDIDVRYSDEEKISSDGQPRLPFFKPGWSPEFACGVMYPGHLLCVRRTLLLERAPIDSTYDGIQDFEFLLRLSERTQRIRHIPATLYQWRMLPQSSAAQGDVKGHMETLQVRAVQAHLQRLGRSAVAHGVGGHRVLLRPPTEFAPPAFHHVGGPITTVADLLSLSASFSESFVLVGPATDTTTPAAWVHNLLFHATEHPDAVVAPVLISREALVVESGCTVTPAGAVHRIMFGFDPHGDGYNGSLRCHREVSTVSGLAFAVHRDQWNELQHAAAAVTDRSLSFAAFLAQQAGKVLVIADAQLKLPLSFLDLPQHVDQRAELAGYTDPYWNPRFDPSTADYQLRPPAVPAIRFELETPLPHRTRDRRIWLRGWCLTQNHESISGLRLVASDWMIPGQTGLARPDVAQAHAPRQIPAPGFELCAELPPGSYLLDLQIRLTAESAWQSMVYRPIQIDPPPPPASEPSAEEIRKQLQFTFGLHPRHPPRQLSYPSLRPAQTSPDWPALAIVTPSYQQGRYLAQAIDSIATSTCTGLVHVVQDGGSTDQSVDILRSARHDHLQWTSQPDNGQVHAINLGFAQTTGAPTDLMAWLNADDFYLPGTLDFVRNYFETHPNIDMLYGNRVVVDETGAEINQWMLPGHDPDVLALNDFVPQETLFWRRHLWDRVGGLNPRFQFAMDWDFLLRCQAAGARIVHLPQFLACFRVHSHQKTSAQMASIGQAEIDELRRRSLGHSVSQEDLSRNRTLLSFLQTSMCLRSNSPAQTQGCRLP